MVDVSKLREATLNKLRIYKSLLDRGDNNGDIPFWDIVVLTGVDDEQKTSYEQQLQVKLDRGEIPRCTSYHVFADPKGPKIGNGGATLHVLEQLELKVPSDQLDKAKILLLHAGGYSQRLPHVSIIGKIFMALPFGDPTMFQMLEMLLVMYIDFPAKMNPGVFVTASDIIFLFDTCGDWSFKETGFTAIGLPESTEIGRTHGVYVPEDMKALREQYNKDPSKSAIICGVKQFLHKVTAEVMESSGAIIPGLDQVYVDNSYYFDRQTAVILNEFYKKNKPLTCEIDAYGDFLQALGPGANMEYTKNTVNVTTETSDLVHMRELVFHLLKGTRLNVILFHQGVFIHTGTTKEFLYHYCQNDVMKNVCECRNQVMVQHINKNQEQLTATSPKKKRISFSDSSHLMHSVVEDAESITIEPNSVIEYCYIESGVHIDRNCILSNLHIPAGSIVPANCYLHTVPVMVNDEVNYATFCFEIHDSMKTSVAKENRHELLYFGTAIGNFLECLRISSLDDVWFPKCDRFSLWNAKLFPIFSTRQQSTQYAIEMIAVLKNKSKGCLPESSGQRLSMAELLELKSVCELLKYHSYLRSLIQ